MVKKADKKYSTDNTISTDNTTSTDSTISTNKPSTVPIYSTKTGETVQIPCRPEKNRRYAVTNYEKTLTKQSHRAECNINSIMMRYQNSGVMEHLNRNQPQYLDLSSGLDYQTALHRLQNAQTLFDDLPAVIRKRFSNNPAEFVEFAENPQNIQQLVDHGLADVVEKLDLVPANLVPIPEAPSEPSKTTEKKSNTTTSP